jgi:ABC-type nitrate/sulfonate/bicarbonate transport system ATPase subunit
MVFVTHSIEEALYLADHTVIMSSRRRGIELVEIYGKC